MEAFQKSAAGDTVPTCVFILDDPAEGGDPKSLPLGVRVNDDDRVAPTSFDRIDTLGANGIPAERFKLEKKVVVDELARRFAAGGAPG